VSAVLQPVCGRQGTQPAARRGVREASGGAGDSQVEEALVGVSQEKGLYISYTLARWRRGSSRGHEGGGGWEAPAGGWPGTERAHMAGRIRRWPMMEWHVNAMTVLGLPPGATTRRSGASSAGPSSA
jgi:hypothetical protein